MKKIAILLTVINLAILPAYADQSALSLSDSTAQWREKSLYQTVSHNWNTFLRFLVEEQTSIISRQS